MVDFNKKILNSDKFRTPAITFINTGNYCQYPKGTSEYFNFWETEADRCKDGYTADDGDYITGYNYFYLNYCPIQRIVYRTDDSGVTKRTRELQFPDFYDYDYCYFQALQEAENQGKHLIVAKARRKGFEQPESEEVLTPNGFVTMGSLKVGDFVINPDGKACKVIEINEQGEQEVYEVELQDGRKVRCGENHLWSTINSTRGKLHIKTTKEYSKLKLKQGSKGKEFYPYKLPSVKPIDFEQPPGKIDPYVLGVLLGDGYICGTQIRFSTDDTFIVEELTKRLPNYTIKSLPDKFQYVIISDQKGIHELGRELKTLGLRVKANKKFIPLEYKLAPIECRMELLQGLMDTGGSCTKGASTFVSTSEQLVDDVAFLCRSLGKRCKKSNEIPGRNNVDFGNGNFSNTLPHWELIIITEENIFKLPRKLEKLRHDRTYKYNAIGLKSIKSLGYKEKQRCIIVDHIKSLYLTKDFIPTHNSYKGAAMLCRNFFLIPDSKSYVYASNKQYLTEDGILTKSWDYMDFIDTNTAWGKKRQVANTQLRRKASMLVTDDFGNKVEVGYKSEIIGLTLKDNPDAGHPYSQTVYTPDGKKQWKDITVGSELFANDGTITRVSEVKELGEVDIYEFTLSDGRIVKSTADHKWEIIRKGCCRKNNKVSKDWKIYELSTLDIHKLTMNKSYLSNPCKLNKQYSVQYKETPVPIDPYTFGLLLEDTSSSRDKFIPDVYKYNSENNRLSVLNGLLDTNGVIKDSGVIELPSKSIRLIQDAAWLCRSLGINCKYTTREIKGAIRYRLFIYTVANYNILFNSHNNK